MLCGHCCTSALKLCWHKLLPACPQLVLHHSHCSTVVMCFCLFASQTCDAVRQCCMDVTPERTTDVHGHAQGCGKCCPPSMADKEAACILPAMHRHSREPPDTLHHSTVKNTAFTAAVTCTCHFSLQPSQQQCPCVGHRGWHNA